MDVVSAPLPEAAGWQEMWAWESWETKDVALVAAKRNKSRYLSFCSAQPLVYLSIIIF